MERIKLTVSEPVAETPPVSAQKTEQSPPIVNSGTITEDEAIKAADNANIPLISQQAITPNSGVPTLPPVSGAAVSAGNLIDGKNCY